MFKIGHENVQLKIKTVQSIRNPLSLFLVVAKIGSKCILSVSNFTRQRLNSFKVLALVSLFVKVFHANGAYGVPDKICFWSWKNDFLISSAA